MNLKQTPEQWEIANPEKKQAIREILSDVFAGGEPVSALDIELVYFVLRSCVYAATYDSDADRFRAMRQRQAEEHSTARKKALAAVTKLREALEPLRGLTPAAVSHMTQALPARGIHLSIDEGMRLAVALDTMLDELSTGLNRSALGRHNGSYEHRYRHGCLLYPESIEGKSQPQPDTMLLFAVVLHFRRHWLRLDGLDQGAAMPKSEVSRYKLAAAIVQEIFPESSILCAKSAEQRLSQLVDGNEGLCWMSWPHEPL